MKVKAGYRTVGFTFLANTHIPGDDLNQHYLRSVLDTNPIPGFIFYPQVGQVKILGPYNGDAVHRRAQPQEDPDVHAGDAAGGDGVRADDPDPARPAGVPASDRRRTTRGC